MTTDRRKFLQFLSTGAFGAAFAPTIKRALAIPAHHRTGTIADVEHVVFLMQENRSFDHYFGTLRGVRGFGDPRAVKLPNGDSVWAQPNGLGKVLPFHPAAPDLGLAFLEDLPHGWADTQAAWNKGKYDQWIPTKGTTAMAYLTRNDIPFHYALADAFTVCDAYHCSVFGSTDPNRYHMWTGWVGNDGKGGGPVLNNAEAGYDWSTYPERLQRAGISWKVYQDAGAGLDAAHYWGWGDDAFIGNYGDNSLLYFHQYQNAAPGSALYQGARTATNISEGGTLFDQLRADIAARRLPQVSWLVAPEAYSEHGNWPANYGAWYVSQCLEALTADPELWSKTVFFVMFDENDGFFDHVVPPTPPQSRSEGLSTIDTTHEIFPGDEHFVAGPIGLGVRVPMLVISPWSKGGWVSSEVFDHTSLIQFLERRFAPQYPDLIETNITKWRRAVAGDLTSAFNFKSPNDRIVALPNTAAYYPADFVRHDDYRPAPTSQALPSQEPGVRPARAVPYELKVVSNVDFAANKVRIRFANSGAAAAVFQVRSGDGTDGPWTYTVGSHGKLSETWTFTDENSYDLTAYGPNGFMRAFKGSLSGNRANLIVEVDYDCSGNSISVSVEIQNRGRSGDRVHIYDAYNRQTVVQFIGEGDRWTRHFPLAGSFGWYDFTVQVDGDPTFAHRLAGHVETGEDSMTDPLLGGRTA